LATGDDPFVECAFGALPALLEELLSVFADLDGGSQGRKSVVWLEGGFGIGCGWGSHGGDAFWFWDAGLGLSVCEAFRDGSLILS
jgi:hypothetical protein